MSWIVFVLGLALIGLVTFLLASSGAGARSYRAAVRLREEDQPSSRFWVEFDAERRERQEAWAFWRWCNAVYLKSMEENAPAEIQKIQMNSDGMWVVGVYDGAKSWQEEFWSEHDYLVAPWPKPDGYYSYRTIGPPEGFTSRQAAQVFLRGYQREIVRKDPIQ